MSYACQFGGDVSAECYDTSACGCRLPQVASRHAMWCASIRGDKEDSVCDCGVDEFNDWLTNLVNEVSQLHDSLETTTRHLHQAVAQGVEFRDERDTLRDGLHQVNGWLVEKAERGKDVNPRKVLFILGNLLDRDEPVVREGLTAQELRAATNQRASGKTRRQPVSDRPWDPDTPRRSSDGRCASCSQHEQVAKFKETVDRVRNLAISGIQHANQNPAKTVKGEYFPALLMAQDVLDVINQEDHR